MSKLGVLLCCLVWAGIGCSDRQHRNPLDPQVVDPALDLVPLEAVAGNREVKLRWDYRTFADVSGYRLYRRIGDGGWDLFQELGSAAHSFDDLQVENGTTYAYQLALLIRGEGERLQQPLKQATPGPQAGWAADMGSGVVWRISPDNRAAFFGQGRFPGLNALGVDRRDGSCWVSDRFFRGLVRISATGEATEHPAAVGEAGLLSIDSDQQMGWLVDNLCQTVSWFALAPLADSLELAVVDARFEGLKVVKAWQGSCWIGASGRVLHYWREEARRMQWEVERPTALAPTAEGGAWALVHGGQALVYLEPHGGIREVALPFAEGVAVEADPQSGACWVAGTEGVVSLALDGTSLAQWDGGRGLTGLALDGVHGHLWLTTLGQLLKLTPEGQVLSRLGGFASLGGIEVDPGISR